jgi:hypothetical protein
MANLTKKEIISELKNIGINSTAEINVFYIEYKKYLSQFPQGLRTRAARKIKRQLLQKDM